MSRMIFKHTLIVIAGPTAVGKTAVAIHLAKHFNTEIISADSRQFFKEMSIGTAKPNASELSEVKHHFIDSHSISQDYNVGKYETEAITLLEDLFSKNNVLVLIGGSGLYINAVCEGFDPLPEANEEIREKIDALLEKEGLEGLQKLLKELDPVYYDQVDLQNPQRMGRALEVCLSSGKPYSSLRSGKTKKRNFNILKIGLEMPRELLYERIDKRVDEMMKMGLLEEVKQLLPYKTKNALQTVGYKELFDHLEGNSDLGTAISLIKQHTRNFAKRQLTWFKRDKEIKWFNVGQEKEILLYLNDQHN